MIKAIGIYFVIGYGSDCDGVSAFKCKAFVDEQFADNYCDNQNEWSDGVTYIVTSNMAIVNAYCNEWERSIPLAYISDEERINCSYTPADYLSNL